MRFPNNTIRLIVGLTFCFISTQSSAQDYVCPPFSQSVMHDCYVKRVAPKVNTAIYRTYDGRYNNQRYTEWGATQTTMARKYGIAYYDNNDGNTMIDRGNPRTISNLVSAQTESIESEEGLSALVFTFLQFLDHDITLTEGDVVGETEDIPVPIGDVFFDPNRTGAMVIPFHRTEAAPNTGTVRRPRRSLNFLSAWIDGSGIYGNDAERAAWLRSGTNGKLKSYQSPNGELLPCNTINGDCDGQPIDPHAPSMGGNRDRCGDLVKVFVAGDVRANEQVGLTAMHTLFLREHNRICDILVASGSTNDESNYQYARKIVGGMVQSITYNEVLPALGINFGPYRYNARRRPDIRMEFATAAFRLGHTMVTEDVLLTNADCTTGTVAIGCDDQTVGVFGGVQCQSMCTLVDVSGALTLRDAFFNPSILANNGLEQVLVGLAGQTQQEVDTRVTGSLRNFLFGLPGQGGLDLVALNIQRGRDHGLPDYNTLRRIYRQRGVESFSDITSDVALQLALEEAYGDVDNIDAWVGLLAEDRLAGKQLGPTLFRILEEQFGVIRSGDRFYFENDGLIKTADKELIRSTRLADIITRNTDFALSDAFVANECTGMKEPYCSVTAEISNEEWIEEVFINDYNNRSGNNGGYADFSDQVIDLRANAYEPIYLSTGYSGFKYVEYWAVWIDLNKDGDYNDAGEKVFEGRNRYSVKGYIYLPSTTDLGLTGMRISMSYYRHDDTCEDIKYGEIEDYTVNILPAQKGSRVDGSNKQTQDIVVLDDDTNLNVYPNPTAGPATVKFYGTQEQGALLTILSTGGVVVYQTKLNIRAGENYIDIDASNYPQGLYTVFLDREKTGRTSTKLVVAKN